MTKLTAAITQMASENDWEKNCDKAERLVRDAAAKGAQLVLLQELFDGDYFCIEQHARFLKQAHEIDRHPTVKRFAALAKELGVVLPVSVFERAGNAHYNTTVIVDADGRELGIYRKSHIPDGRGYQEKFYFSPGDTGFKVWDTAAGRIGLGICWDQWFPECARAMALMGAEVLLYPTAIGSEPPNPQYDSSTHWQNCMRGHAAANIMPLLASNRVGQETAPDGRSDLFYGRSFIADYQGEKIAEMDRTEEGVRVASFDLEAIGELRRSWGVFRDRRPELYGALMTLDGKTKSAAV
ncbi:N-carbamoylputrescine amidase [Aestuariivirga litoralis]|uniref:N-carbamoylputrescine amidase n=1 Tax=Aestuariivirga litoralis TaxID=2650924 RepID=A0A2W2C6I1_9HYPH|nr:N-carbamoylputrescine amidase [Aestuariivirga litoralis]PZF75743.1 N-carbamoylputrescine amidase [Aestuariivirga litoralis]